MRHPCCYGSLQLLPPLPPLLPKGHEHRREALSMDWSGQRYRLCQTKKAVFDATWHEEHVVWRPFLPYDDDDDDDDDALLSGSSSSCAHALQN